MKRKTIWLLLIAAHGLPIAAWAMVKPIRVVAPGLLGLSCSADDICTDDPSRLAEARTLLNDARAFVAKDLGVFQGQPRAVFCSTLRCDQQFGLGRVGAVSVGQIGVVMSTRAWHPYFVRHELIHQLQNERLGTFNAWLFKPSWLIEGMAYARSQDPRQPLPEPLQGWRQQYRQWEGRVGVEQVWVAAQGVPRQGTALDGNDTP
jgi:hypothetical protein